MMKKIRITLLFTLLFTLFSCVNDIPQPLESENVVRPSPDGGTYLCIDVESISAERTILPSTSDYSKSKLTNLVLEGAIHGSGDAPRQLAHADTYENFKKVYIPIAVGSWDLTLSAELNGIAFSGTTEKNIVAGSVNQLGFTLSAGVSEGGLKITVNFTGEATKVVATLQDANKNDISNNPVTEIEDFTMNGSTSSFVYERSISDGSNKLESGTYFIKFEFYNETVPLNTYRSYVRIASGITTTATISIDLDETYSIEYEYYEGTAEFTESELTQYNLQIVGGTVLPLFYSRRSETFTLPDVQLDGYDFTGWTLNDTAITQITKGTVGDLELHANFEATGGGNGGNGGSTPAGVTYVDLGLPSGTLWATMNVGATRVTDYGTEFAWSVETTRASIMNNYSASGEVLSATDDHAIVEWGSNWVTPTTAQIQELYDNCYFEPVNSYNGENVSGYVVYLAKDASHTNLVRGGVLTGDITNYQKSGYSESDPHIFLPADGSSVWMWSSTYQGIVDRSGVDTPTADLFGLSDQWDIIEIALVGEEDNYGEYPVRPVFAKKSDFKYITGATIETAPEDYYGGGAFAYAASTPVTVRNFYMCEHEVTQAEYETYCFYGGDTPSLAVEDDDIDSTKENSPAYNISWYDALVYCNLRSINEGLDPVYSVYNSAKTAKSTNPANWDGIQTQGSGDDIKYCGPDDRTDSWEWTGEENVEVSPTANGYRLPSNEEWEYAARGGIGNWNNQTEYSGSATYTNVGFEDFDVHQIKKKQPNTLQIYDMSGSVSEWLFDIYGEDYRGMSPNTYQDALDYSYGVEAHIRSNSTNIKQGIRLIRYF